jgi:hypothetical protein
MVWFWWRLEILSIPTLNYVLKIFLKYVSMADSSMTALFYSFADRRSPSRYRPKRRRTSWQDLMGCDLQSESEQVQDSCEGQSQQAIRDDAMKKRKSPKFAQPKGKIYEMSPRPSQPMRASNHHTRHKASQAHGSGIYG